MKIKNLPLKSILFLCSVAILASSCKSQADKQPTIVDAFQLNKSLPDWAKSANIYEANIRQYTAEGTFKAFENHLVRLKEMGVDLIWLMPINPIGLKNRKGKLGSYYSIKDYKAINPEFGTLQDFKDLVKKAHQLGMHLIIDWVANHSSWDNVWIAAHPDWYTHGFDGKISVPQGTDWTDVAGLNYNNADLRKAMLDAMVYWIRETDIDGFRCDVADRVPVDFWKRARRTIDSIKPNCFYLAESSQALIHQAFDADYNWQLKDNINRIAKGAASAKDLIRCLEDDVASFKTTDLRMQFITNHDENSWTGSEYERLGENKLDAFTALIYMLPGMPLTYSGQEEPLKRKLSFFEKDNIQFSKYAKADLLKHLNFIKKENKALWNVNYGGSMKVIGNTSPKNIFSFVRQKDENQVLCLFNLSNKIETFKFTDEVQEGFKNTVGAKIAMAKGKEYELKPWEYAVLISR